MQILQESSSLKKKKSTKGAKAMWLGQDDIYLQHVSVFILLGVNEVGLQAFVSSLTLRSIGSLRRHQHTYPVQMAPTRCHRWKYAVSPK